VENESLSWYFVSSLEAAPSPERPFCISVIPAQQAAIRPRFDQ